MINFVNYKLKINDFISDGLASEIYEFLRVAFEGLGLVKCTDDNTTYFLVIDNDVNYSKLNEILTNLYNKYNVNLVLYKQIFIRKNNKN